MKVLRGTSSPGFTLIELMLAILLLAIIMTIVYGLVVSTIQAQQRIEEVELGSELGPALILRIRQDLEGVFLPKTDVEYFVGTDRKGSSGDRDRIDFVTTSMSYGAADENQEAAFHAINEVGYQLRDNAKDSSVGILCRREDLFLDDEPLKGGTLVELYDRVKQFDVQYRTGDQWTGEWNNRTKEGKLPEAVKVELKILVGEGDREEVYRTEFTFPE